MSEEVAVSVESVAPKVPGFPMELVTGERPKNPVLYRLKPGQVVRRSVEINLTTLAKHRDLRVMFPESTVAATSSPTFGSLTLDMGRMGQNPNP